MSGSPLNRSSKRGSTTSAKRTTRQRLAAAISVDLGAGGLHHRLPRRELGLHEVREFLRRTADHLAAVLADRISHARILQRLVDLGVELGDDRRGRAGGRED